VFSDGRCFVRLSLNRPLVVYTSFFLTIASSRRTNDRALSSLTVFSLDYFRPSRCSTTPADFSNLSLLTLTMFVFSALSLFLLPAMSPVARGASTHGRRDIHAIHPVVSRQQNTNRLPIVATQCSDFCDPVNALVLTVRFSTLSVCG
jgi:hypothetical protein